MADSRILTLWSDQGFTLYLLQEDSGGYSFEFTKVNNEQGSTMVIAAWVQEKLKSPENISVFPTNDYDQGLSIDIIWNSDHFVFRDTINSNEGFQSSTVVLQTKFFISIVYVIWSLGLLLVGEGILDNLHIFNSTSLKCLGYITLQQNSKDSLCFDRHTATLWCLVQKYDDLTKSRTTHLNCYRLPEFQLFSSSPMPRGFSNYHFVRLKENPGEKKQITSPTFTVTVLCLNELVPNYQLLHFVGPKKPYYKQKFQDLNSLLRQIVQLPRNN
ncbi:hypothetical protein ZYGR_0AI02360 [Zygosaccharomyces rouxii]|uniref:Uncharacterized protein n=1 Tax=Zygosaccharomyces rouxii TaxID=4956 RepID=A0A1Q3AB20_ZYGRO|nr:hypothetical protein ZYGR_0AI02360 [Zygosaccharomyces rouxii]